MGKVTELSRRRFVGSALSAAALAALPAHSMTDAKMQKIGGNGMITLTPYLLFDGKCQQAMEFYKSCFGGELTATKVKDSPAKDFMPAFQQEKIVNARLRNGKLEISASDWLRPAQTPIRGNIFRHLRSTQRQVWCPVDVSNRQEGLGKRHYGNKTT